VEKWRLEHPHDTPPLPLHAVTNFRPYLRSTEIPTEAIAAIVRIAEASEQGLSGEPSVSEWFRAIAPYQTFPPHGVEWLFSQLNS
jgi:hypothetical protein